MAAMDTDPAEPPRDCGICPRLRAYRHENRARHPDWFNAPVPCLGPKDARLAVVGLAPGVSGANRTGRPFTGDHAGILLYAALLAHGFAAGRYDARADDGLALLDCRIVNAVRCVPPQNKPSTAEIRDCNRFLAAALAEMPRLRSILALGTVAHEATLRALGVKPSAFKFAHGTTHTLPDGRTLTDSYHVSRYNTSTRRLTERMFMEVVEGLKGQGAALDPLGPGGPRPR